MIRLIVFPLLLVACGGCAPPLNETENIYMGEFYLARDQVGQIEEVITMLDENLVVEGRHEMQDGFYLYNKEFYFDGGIVISVREVFSKGRHRFSTLYDTSLPEPLDKDVELLFERVESALLDVHGLRYCGRLSPSVEPYDSSCDFSVWGESEASN